MLLGVCLSTGLQGNFTNLPPNWFSSKRVLFLAEAQSYEPDNTKRKAFLSETFDWLHLSRRPNQVSPNFGQRVETLRDYNDEVKSIWLFFEYFSNYFLNRPERVFFPRLSTAKPPGNQRSATAASSTIFSLLRYTPPSAIARRPADTEATSPVSTRS
jgi:hypothetical protein